MKRLTILCVTFFILTLGCVPRLAQAKSLPTVERLVPVDRIGGSSLAVVVNGDYAFVGQSAEFTVLDISDPTQPRRIAYLPLAANYLISNQGYVYATNKMGLIVIDVNQPTKPIQVAFLAMPAALQSIALAENILYVAAPKTGFYSIDINDPKHPTVANFVALPGSAEIAVQGDFLYVGSASGFQIINMEDANQPQLLAENHDFQSIEAITLDGNYLYLTTADGKLGVFDISNPQKPTVMGMLTIPTYTKNLQVRGDLAYVANGNRGVAVVDISNRKQPQLLAVKKIGTLVTAIDVVDQMIYATDVSDGGLHIVAGDKPQQMIEIGTYRVPGITIDLALDNRYAYLINGMEGHLTVVEHNDCTNLVGVGHYRMHDRVAKIAASTEHLYAFGAHRNIQILDHTNPIQLITLGTLELEEDATTLTVQKMFAFVGDRSGVLHIYDMSSANMPIKVGSFVAKGTIGDIAIYDKTLLVSVGTNNVVLLDIVNPAQPMEIASIVLPRQIRTIAINNRYGYIVTADRTLYILDIQHSNNIQIVGSLKLGVRVNNISVQESYVYLALGEVGIQVIDVSQPTHPVLIAAYDTPGNAQNLEVIANRIFVADGYAGLLTLSMESLQHEQNRSFYSVTQYSHPSCHTNFATNNPSNASPLR